MYCRHCGTEINDYAVVCPHCGCPVGKIRHEDTSDKSRLVATILCFFFGYLGVHRFYAGRIVSGIFMILTLGGLGIWTFVDFVVILCGSFKDSKGRHIYEWLD